MLRGHRVRLYPNAEQRTALAHTFGCVRWIYNAALELCQASYKATGKQPRYHELQNVFLPRMKAEQPWLCDANSQSLQVSLQNLAAAFDAFFAKAARYPRFKTKRAVQAAAYYSSAYVKERRANGWGTVRIPKAGLIRAKLHREIVGKVKHITVTLDRAGRYWATLQVDDGVTALAALPVDPAKVVGLDLGLRHFATLSTGEQIDNPRHLRRAESNLSRKQGQLARKQKGSQNREKARLEVAKAHARVADARKDFLHVLSRRLVNENQAIIVENLGPRRMMKTNLAKSIGDAAWSRFVGFLAYKAETEGKRLVKVDRFFPSTKLCNGCGHVSEVAREATEWTCTECGSIHDRDINAALNIRTEGLRLLAEVQPATASGRHVRRWAKSRLARRRLKEEASVTT